MMSPRPFIEVTRPANAVICMVSVLTGGLLGGRPLDAAEGIVRELAAGTVPPLAARLAAAALSASLILAAGNVLNDICDVDADRVNAPHRPLPSCRLGRTAAIVEALVLAVLGLLLSLPLGVEGVAVALTAAALLVAYDTFLKGVPLAGNAAVALLGGAAFVYGGIAGGCVTESLVPGGFAVLYHLGREVIKDAADHRGDSAAGVGTAATAWGVRTANRIASVILSLLATLLIAPYLAGMFGTVYLVMAVVLVWPFLFGAVWTLSTSPDEERLRRLASALKAGMPLGLAVILAGFQGW